MKTNLVITFLLLTLLVDSNAQQEVQSYGQENRNHFCTVVAGMSKKGLIIGNNEDWVYPFTSIFIIPATDKEYGRMLFGFSFSETNPGYCGGINEKGLFIDGNGIERTGWDPESGKKYLRGNYESQLLANCATVEEVVQIYKNNNTPGLQNGKYLVADKTGESAVIEWGQGKLQILRRKEKYQISTNFVQSNYSEGKYSDFRYNLAEKILRQSNEITIDVVKSVLNATHWEEYSGSMTTTLYSYICDLRKGDVYIYNFHDFDNPVKLNIYNELKKGKSSRSILSLFSNETFSENRFRIASIGKMFYERYSKNGIEAALSLYNELKYSENKLFKYNVGEDQLLNFGKHLIENRKTSDIPAVIQFLMKEYPMSENVYCKVAEAIENTGNIDLAIKNYEKVLEINPFNGLARGKWNMLNWEKTYKKSGIAALQNQINDMRLKNPRFVSENDLNNLGYIILNNKKIDDAIKIFSLIVELYPESPDAFDSLGEAYLKDGQTELAIRYYQRSFELNPENDNAKKVLEQLQKK